MSTMQVKCKKILIIFYDMISDMISNKKYNPIVTKLFMIVRKLNISIASITQSYFAVPKHAIQNSTNCFIMKISRKRELQQIAFNHSLDIEFKYFINFYKKCNGEPYSLLVIDITFA